MPGVVAAVLLVLIRGVFPVVAPGAEFFDTDAGLIGLMGGMICALAIMLWWLFFSRATWSERLGAFVVAVGVMVAVRSIAHPSIQNGMMGMLFFIYTIPIMTVALVVWASMTRSLVGAPRWIAMLVAFVLAASTLAVLRTDGLLGSASEFAWRWTPTAEQQLLAQVEEPPAVPVAAPIPAPATASVPETATPIVSPAVAEPVEPRVEWPGFRGTDRDGVVHGVTISTAWATSPPVELWRRPIGPGWSSFAVSGDVLYTQEQRGDDEIVAAYRVSTGAPVWRHKDAARFWESNGGAGPRGTPTIHRGRVYAMGATGIVNALDAATGKVMWTRNAAQDTGGTLPGWGFTSSPVVVDDVVIVAASGTMAGYDLATGNVRWVGPSQGGSYSSPQVMTIGGVTQVVLLSGTGATSVSPATGAVLWEHAWPGGSIVQPAVTQDGDIVINSIAGTGGVGTRRLAVTGGASGWTVAERWTSIGLKPYFNDFVVHQGFAYGFDGNILACIDLADGTRKWKGGRYGNGQMVLLADQNLIMVLSEEGEFALVNANPAGFKELARIQVLDSKTWNHPVVVGDLLLVRNGEEMAAYRLPVVGR
jgi:outer membrane protein assembly factor BamB